VKIQETPSLLPALDDDIPQGFKDAVSEVDYIYRHTPIYELTHSTASASPTTFTSPESFVNEELKVIVDEFLAPFQDSMEKVASECSESFDKYKHLIRHFLPTKRKIQEVPNVHPIVNDIVTDLIPAMFKDMGRNDEFVFRQEIPRDYMENPRSCSFRESANFSVKLKKSAEESVQFIPTCYSMITAIECKKPRLGVNSLLQAVHY
jgi:hypothetical protein